MCVCVCVFVCHCNTKREKYSKRRLSATRNKWSRGREISLRFLCCITVALTMSLNKHKVATLKSGAFLSLSLKRIYTYLVLSSSHTLNNHIPRTNTSSTCHKMCHEHVRCEHVTLTSMRKLLNILIISCGYVEKDTIIDTFEILLLGNSNVFVPV